MIATDPAAPGLASFPELLARSRVLTLHCSLTRGSHRLLDASAFERLSPGAIMLNTARGECVDLSALTAALDSGRIAGCGLDVFDPEPPPEIAELARRRNVIVTPHSAGYFDGLALAVEEEVVATIRAIRDGAPLTHRVRADSEN